MNIESLDREQFVISIQTSTKKDLDKLIKEVITDSLKGHRNLVKVYETFNYVYDNIYHDLIFKRIHMNKKMVKLLETLATPIYERSESEQKKIINNVLRKIA